MWMATNLTPFVNIKQGRYIAATNYWVLALCYMFANVSSPISPNKPLRKMLLLILEMMTLRSEWKDLILVSGETGIQANFSWLQTCIPLSHMPGWSQGLAYSFPVTSSSQSKTLQVFGLKTKHLMAFTSAWTKFSFFSTRIVFKIQSFAYHCYNLAVS